MNSWYCWLHGSISENDILPFHIFIINRKIGKKSNPDMLMCKCILSRSLHYERMLQPYPGILFRCKWTFRAACFKGNGAKDIEEAKQYLDDYEEWREEAKKGGGSFYEAFDLFQADSDVTENDEETFYGSVFQEFNEQWQGKSQAVSEKKSEVTKEEKVDFSKLSLEERAKLLPSPTGDQMAELKEYEYRNKHYGVEKDIQKKQKNRGR